MSWTTRFWCCGRITRAVGLWIVKTRGDAQAVLASDAALLAHQEHWFVREVLGMVRRTFARLEVSSRSIYAVVEPGSCFAGSLLELALAADRVYMLADSDARVIPVRHQFWQPAGRQRSLASGVSLLPGRRGDRRRCARGSVRRSMPAMRSVSASSRRLRTTSTGTTRCGWPSKARVALSPDALTGLEANLRFGPRETMASRIFGRLSAWQNWIFIRPNAVGPSGALKVYGTGQRAQFDQERV